MSEETATYLNDILPGEAVVQIQGKTIFVDPLKFTVKDEIAIRQAFQNEIDTFNDADPKQVFGRVIKSRELILAAGEAVIPKVCRGWTVERVGEELSYDAIGALLTFFLRSDWRNVTLDEPTTPVPTTTTPTDPIPSKKTRGRPS